MLAAGQWKKISLNHSWPKYSYWNTIEFDSALAGMHSRYPGERCQLGCSPVLPPKCRGKELRSLRRNPQSYSYTEYAYFSWFYQSSCRKSHRKDEWGWETHRLSPQCSECSRGTSHGTRVQTYRKEATRKQELVSVIFHPITWHPPVPPNVLQHHRQYCDNETSQRLGLFFIFYKNNTKPPALSASLDVWQCHMDF